MARKRRGASGVDIHAHRGDLIAILRAATAESPLGPRRLDRILRDHPLAGRGLFPRDALIAAYRAFAGQDGLPPFDAGVVERLRLNPVRTSSGVTPVTVLTKPFPCPGECIFCPSDVRMPKSYLASEPGAQRAERQAFDPYRQVTVRLAALRASGHPTDKVELIVLGGTWSFYPEPYQIWFVKRLFEALNDFGASRADGAEDEIATSLQRISKPAHARDVAPPVIDTTTGVPRIDGSRLPGRHTYNAVVQDIYGTARGQRVGEAADLEASPRSTGRLGESASWNDLDAAHSANEEAGSRCVGLVVETRPDHVDAAEVLRLRRLGVTKVQIGLQSLDDAVLAANKRGHGVAAARRAMRLLRRAGFKLHAHWMPNLLGATPASDRADYGRLWDDPDFRPDELKVYPCSLVASAELVRHHRSGAWQPYSEGEMVDLLADCMAAMPPYVRLTRMVRDIPGTDIVAGDPRPNLRQTVERVLANRGRRRHDIRAREVRGRPIDADALVLDAIRYRAGAGDEVFLQFVTPDGDARIAAFLRLSLPDGDAPAPIDAIDGAAIIREVHVYGQAVEIGAPGAPAAGRAQHGGLGGRLIARATEMAAAAGFARVAVISAIGTRAYYRRLGFADAGLYQVRDVRRL